MPAALMLSNMGDLLPLVPISPIHPLLPVLTPLPQIPICTARNGGLNFGGRNIGAFIVLVGGY